MTSRVVTLWYDGIDPRSFSLGQQIMVLVLISKVLDAFLRSCKLGNLSCLGKQRLLAKLNDFPGDGPNPISVKKGIDKTVQKLVVELENKARPLKGPEHIKESLSSFKTTVDVEEGMEEIFSSCSIVYFLFLQGTSRPYA